MDSEERCGRECDCLLSAHETWEREQLAYWSNYFGLKPGMTAGQRREQLERVDPRPTPHRTREQLMDEADNE
jgi:hypothetical protein